MKNRLIAILFVVGLVLGTLVLVLPMPEDATAEPIATQKCSGTFFGTFDTVVTVIGYAPSQEAFDAELTKVEELFQHYHKLFDNYHAYEGIQNLYTLNRDAAKAPVAVDKDLFDLLVYCKEKQAAIAPNTVNIAMGSVLSIWHDYRDAADADPSKAVLPPMEKLQAAALHTDINNLTLNEKDMTVFYEDPLLQLDLGAIAKGYTAERAAQYLLSSTMPSFIISAGGNVRAGNQPLDGRARWGIGIQDPDGDVLGNGDLMDTVYLKNLSVVTSGDYQRYFVVDGVRYHHLISPKTLMPADHFRAVTIITEDSTYADYLSTAVFLLPYEEGRALVDSLDGVEALWVLNDRSVLMTDGMKTMAKSQGATSK